MAGVQPFKPDVEVTVSSPSGAEDARLEVRGELDSGSCQQVVTQLQEVFASGASRLALDLGPMTFVDSAGMRVLILIERMAAERGVELTVIPPPDEVTELLRTAGLLDRDRPRDDSDSLSSERFVERIELELPRAPHSPARARSELRDCVAAHNQTELANVVLLTSEIVTNAVVHPRGVGESPIGLRVTVYRDGVRVEVEDSGDGFPHSKPAPSEGECGRGLFLVERFSDRWGSGRVQTDAGPRFRVWFERRWEERGWHAGA